MSQYFQGQTKWVPGRKNVLMPSFCLVDPVSVPAVNLLFLLVFSPEIELFKH